MAGFTTRYPRRLGFRLQRSLLTAFGVRPFLDTQLCLYHVRADVPSRKKNEIRATRPSVVPGERNKRQLLVYLQKMVSRLARSVFARSSSLSSDISCLQHGHDSRSLRDATALPDLLQPHNPHRGGGAEWIVCLNTEQAPKS